MANSCEPDERTDESVSSSLPTFTQYYTGDDGMPLNATLVFESSVCEECEEIKPNVVSYSLPMIFLVPHLFQVDELIKCRRCMRTHILSRVWLVILLAHIFSPFIIAWWFVVFVQTFYRKPY